MQGARKMKTKKWLFYLLAGLLGSCVPSLHPLYTDKELVFEEKLLGSWGQDDEVWEFKKGQEEKSYDLITKEDGKKGEFTVHLVKIQASPKSDKEKQATGQTFLFLDLYPKEPELQASDFYKFHLLPVHTFIKIEQIEPVLKMRVMNPDKLKEILEDRPKVLKHEVLEDRIVLTASTREMQKFMLQHAEDEDLFSEATTLERVRPKDAEKSEETTKDKPIT
jgi:hypothetical protein